MNPAPGENWLDRIIRFCIENRVIVFLAALLLVAWGLMTAPFDWHMGGVWRAPVPVDAIPDIGENQQIVFTDWPGRSPQDIEDQITYPLSAALLGLPGVKTVRSYSMFGFSMIYVIFNDDIEFYWARTRVLEKLSSLSVRELPPDVKPVIGPDATALGQVFWYTLEGLDGEGRRVGGWDLHELRSIQDWYVRYALTGVPGVSEVAAVGGFVQEFQIDVDPDLMRYRDVRIEDVVNAVRRANVDVGARTIEVNRVEYVIRGLGFIKNLEHIRDSVIKLSGDTPVLVRHVAEVTLGPAERRGVLDAGGEEAVGGVVVVRYGENPLAVIQRVKQKIAEISLGLPKRTLPDGTVSQVRIVPFYDRTRLIHETLDTLHDALTNEILITIVVVIVMMAHLRSSLLIAGLLPLSVLFCFIAMKLFKVDANIVALSGIAIAIGTLVDVGIIVTENIFRHLKAAGPGEEGRDIILRATREVSGAVLTAVSTTIVSFLPVFSLVAAEGKLFRPLAFTKTFALAASIGIALFLLPVLADAFMPSKRAGRRFGRIWNEGLIYLGGVLAFVIDWRLGLLVAVMGIGALAARRLPRRIGERIPSINSGLAAVAVIVLLSQLWSPLGPEKGALRNLVFCAAIIGGLLGAFRIFQHYYAGILGWCLDHKRAFLCLPLAILLLGALAWRGYDGLFGWMPRLVNESAAGRGLAEIFPGLGREFMPPLEEGSYLYMPVTMPHASIAEVQDILQRQDRALEALPEIEKATGKLGRSESALDPAPISMIETLIAYRSEYLVDAAGARPTFRFDPEVLDLFRSLDGRPVPAADGKPYHVKGRFARDEQGRLIPDPNGLPFRIWRPALDPRLNPGRDAWPGVRNPNDIWALIIQAASIPGTTVAPRLQPISARIVMLQSGIRASMGVKIQGPDLESIRDAAGQIERHLRQVPSIDPRSVIADRIVGKPYLEIEIDRRAIAQYGIDLQQVQDVIETAIGGRQITTTVQGRERYPVRVRYMRELRDHIDTIGRVLVTAPGGAQVPLGQLADIRYVPGPQEIKGEGTFTIGYVLFDGRTGFAETDVVENARDFLLGKTAAGEIVLPAGVSFSFTGNYENDLRAGRRLAIIVPLALATIFVILYLQFSSVSTSLLIFSGVIVAWAGGFIMIWLYGRPWFLDFTFFGTSMRELFQVHTLHMSVAVWVGFLALFGIAEDDGVVMATYLDSSFARNAPGSIAAIRQATIEASLRRVRPCLMTTATTVLSLIPVLTATGRGSDLMLPMAIPTFGGMVFETATMLVVPVLYCAIRERRFRLSSITNAAAVSRALPQETAN